MTDQEINAAIATECGWINRGPDYWVHEQHDSRDEPPDYCNDLNAMWCAVDGLLDEERIMFYNTLKDMFGGDDEFCDATARQRADAFLRTIGGWK